MGFFDNLSQLNEVRKQMEELKKKMDQVEIVAENNWVKISGNANRKVTDVSLKGNWSQVDQLQLESALKDAFQELSAKTETVMQQEALSLTKGIIPGT
jgi:DNA-binding protein YbaB